MSKSNLDNSKHTKMILEQMKNKVCKIDLENKIKGSGFFCKLPFPDNNNLLPVLISNYQIINDSILKKDKISLSINNEKNIEIKLDNRIKYINKEYDISIIEIKDKDGIENYLDVDETILEKNNDDYIGKSIYLLHYPESEDLNISSGIIKENNKENNFDFNHLCCAGSGSLGGPILNLLNNEVIGMHKNKKEELNIGLFLKYAINDFINRYKNNKNNNDLKLKEFNNKYNLNIKDLNITKLDLSDKKLGDEGLKNVCNIDFKKLKELILYNNEITDIQALQNSKFTKLEKLNLGDNKINNINALEKMNFKELKELYLYDNKISDIEILAKVNFEKLEILHLSYNKISNIKVLEKVNFKNLKILDLYKNEIVDINILEKVKFEKLKKLQLGGNKISDIDVLEKVNFRELKELHLSQNYISKINILEKVKFEKIQFLYLANNSISDDIKVLEKVNFKYLNQLNLSNNYISDLNVFEKAKFDKLQLLDLSGNKKIY